jgi:hypothetical protein
VFNNGSVDPSAATNRVASIGKGLSDHFGRSLAGSGDTYDDVVWQLLGLADRDDSAADTSSDTDATQLREAVRTLEWGEVMYAESDAHINAAVEALDALRHGEATRSEDLSKVVGESVEASASGRLLSGVAGHPDCVETPASGSDRYERVGVFFSDPLPGGGPRRSEIHCLTAGCRRSPEQSKSGGRASCEPGRHVAPQRQPRS